jgi:hypothetical protein
MEKEETLFLETKAAFDEKRRLVSDFHLRMLSVLLEIKESQRHLVKIQKRLEEQVISLDSIAKISRNSKRATYIKREISIMLQEVGPMKNTLESFSNLSERLWKQETRIVEELVAIEKYWLSFRSGQARTFITIDLEGLPKGLLQKSTTVSKNRKQRDFIRSFMSKVYRQATLDVGEDLKEANEKIAESMEDLFAFVPERLKVPTLFDFPSVSKRLSLMKSRNLVLGDKVVHLQGYDQLTNKDINSEIDYSHNHARVLLGLKHNFGVYGVTDTGKKIYTNIKLIAQKPNLSEFPNYKGRATRTYLVKWTEKEKKFVKVKVNDTFLEKEVILDVPKESKITETLNVWNVDSLDVKLIKHGAKKTSGNNYKALQDIQVRGGENILRKERFLSDTSFHVEGTLKSAKGAKKIPIPQFSSILAKTGYYSSSKKLGL